MNISRIFLFLFLISCSATKDSKKGMLSRIFSAGNPSSSEYSNNIESQLQVHSKINVNYTNTSKQLKSNDSNTQSSNKKHPLDFNKIKKLTEKGFKRLDNIREMDAFLLFGPTGSGKTTTGLSLAGYEFESKVKYRKYIDEYGETAYEPKQILDIVDTIYSKRIGHTTNSATLYPEPYEILDADQRNLNFQIVDFAGYGDNRGKNEINSNIVKESNVSEIEVCIEILNYLGTQVANNVKGIGFVISVHDLLAQRGLVLNNLIEIIDSLFEDQDQDSCYQSMFFLITKCQNNYAKNDIYDIIKSLEVDTLKNYQRTNSLKLRSHLNLLKGILNPHKSTKPKLNIFSRSNYRYPNNIYIIDPLDGGKGRIEVLNAINESINIPKKVFRFDSNVSNNFNKIVTDISFNGSELLNICVNTPKYISELEKKYLKNNNQNKNELKENQSHKEELIQQKNERLSDLDNDLKNIKQELEDEKNGNIDHAKQLKNEIEEMNEGLLRNKKDIETERNEINRLQNKLEKKTAKSNKTKKKSDNINQILKPLIIQLDELNLDDVKLYWQSRFYSEKQKYCFKNGKQYKTLSKGTIHTEEKLVDYDDLPYEYYRETSSEGDTIKRLIDNPSEGKYRATYVSGPNLYGKFQANIFVRNKYLPDVKIKHESILKAIEDTKEKKSVVEKNYENLLIKINNLKLEIQKGESNINVINTKIKSETKLIEIKQQAISTGAKNLHIYKTNVKEKLQIKKNEIRSESERFSILIENDNNRIETINKDYQIKANKELETINKEKKELENALIKIPDDIASFEFIKSIQLHLPSLKSNYQLKEFLCLYLQYIEKYDIIAMVGDSDYDTEEKDSFDNYISESENDHIIDRLESSQNHLLTGKNENVVNNSNKIFSSSSIGEIINHTNNTSGKNKNSLEQINITISTEFEDEQGIAKNQQENHEINNDENNLQNNLFKPKERNSKIKNSENNIKKKRKRKRKRNRNRRKNRKKNKIKKELIENNINSSESHNLSSINIFNQPNINLVSHQKEEHISAAVFNKPSMICTNSKFSNELVYDLKENDEIVSENNNYSNNGLNTLLQSQKNILKIPMTIASIHNITKDFNDESSSEEEFLNLKNYNDGKIQSWRISNTKKIVNQDEIDEHQSIESELGIIICEDLGQKNDYLEEPSPLINNNNIDQTADDISEFISIDSSDFNTTNNSDNFMTAYNIIENSDSEVLL